MLQFILLAAVSADPLLVVDIEEKSDVTISLYMHAMSLQALGGHPEGCIPFRHKSILQPGWKHNFCYNVLLRVSVPVRNYLNPYNTVTNRQPPNRLA
jgi:hypothetical protein